MRIAAAVLFLLPLLAGCGSAPDGSDGPATIDGEAALALVRGLVTDADGDPRFRVPGTAGHADARAWLWDTMQVEGWTAQRQPFTGADYTPLDKGQAQTYTDSPAYCSSDEEARLANLTFENFWAVHDEPGQDRRVLLGAHWESKRFASSDPDLSKREEPVLGANDGASGVGLLLQLMRHVSENDVHAPFDISVAFFDGEDGFEDCHPLAGSIYFVSRLQTGDVDRMILLDMVGDPEARFIREGNSVQCDPSLVDLFHTLAPDHGLAENFPGTRTSSIQDDHLPFLAADIPAVDIIDFGRGFPPYWHTTGDTLDKLSADMLGRVGDLVLDVLGDEGFTSTWPATC